jgi:hypothetical protein
MVVFMLFGFVVSKCIGDAEKKSFYTIWVLLKPEKRTFIVWLKNLFVQEMSVHQKNKIMLECVNSTMEINKKQWYFHLGLLLIGINGPFRIMYMEAGKAFEVQLLKLQSNHYVRQHLQRMLVLSCMSIHFRKETLLEICYWCCILDHYFGRVRYLLEESFCIILLGNILKNP